MGIIRTSTARKGLSKYLRDGYKKASSFSRDEKDFCEPILGSLDIFENAENYLNEKKSFSSNYTHITMGYSTRDMAKMDDMSDEERIEFKQNITEEIIRYYTSGYDQDFEVIAYAESHRPKIKEEKNRVTGEVKERLEHDHIAISHLCPLSDTRLQTTFHNNAFMDSVFQTYIAKKYDLDIPRIDGKRSKKDRDFYKKALKNIGNFHDLTTYLDDKNLTYKEVKTKKNHYISIVNKEPRKEDEPKRINLTGRGFEHLVFAVANKDKPIPQDIFDKQKENIEKTRPEDMKLDELGAILDDFHAKRAKQIRKVRSKASTKLLENLLLERDNPVSFNQKEQEKNEDEQYYDEEVEAEKKQQESKIDFEDTVDVELSYSPYKGYQERTFYEHYKLQIGESLHLKGYFIKLKQKNPIFLNKEKGIKVIDRGDVITGACSEKSEKNLRELANVMLDVAEAKGWDLRKTKIRGSPVSEKIMKELISERIAKKILLGRQHQKNYFTSILSRPTTPLSQTVRENVETTAIEKEPSIQEIKEKLSAEDVIAYASTKYKINKEEYGATKDNKINNFTNRQKPKSVIDFFIKEVNLSPKEAFAECRRLYAVQLENAEKTDISNIQDESKEIKSDIEMYPKNDRDTDSSGQSEYSEGEEAISIYIWIDEESKGLNTLLIAKVVKEALVEAVDDESFHAYISEKLNLKKCKYGSAGNSLKFFTQDGEIKEMNLTQIGTSFEEIVDKINENYKRLGESKKEKNIKKNREKKNKPKENS